MVETLTQPPLAIAGARCNLPLVPERLRHHVIQPAIALSAADRLNRECFCIGTDVTALQDWLDTDLKSGGLPRSLNESHPHLFSSLPVFVSRAHVLEMQEVIRAVHAVVGSDAYRREVLAQAPAIATRRPAAHGVLQGYDFHLGTDGPRLIEINTNAGGVMLNAEMGRAQQSCCREVTDLVSGPSDYSSIEDRLFAMFMADWRAARGETPLRHIAIVDATPATQYLYPEFLLFRRLFEARGIRTTIADPAELELVGGSLRHASGPIDLVYNRLTDFYFEQPEHAALARAYEADAVVVTPHPHSHALYANKRNLALLTDATALHRWGVEPTIAARLLRNIPHTSVVRAEDADALWRDRKRLFFKPACGFGSGGAYRGEKLTRRVFSEILTGDYVAQALVPPSERLAADADATPVLKVDLRNYVYDGEVLLIAARLYQGQTTNFRTPGGGFAPVFYPTDSGSCGAVACDAACSDDDRSAHLERE
jgi:hypothetical protein